MRLSEEDILWVKDHTYDEIMKNFNISRPTVSRLLKHYQICAKRQVGSGPKHGPKNNKICGECGVSMLVVPSSNRKYCSRSCMHINEEYLTKVRNIDRSYTQTESFSKAQSKDTTPEFKKFGGRVHRLTQKIYEMYKEEINPNDHPRTICGVDGGYQLDHIITIKFGFENGLSAEELSQKDNLRMLPWKDNLMRNWYEK